MPWKETRPVDERREFIEALSSCLYTMTELCEHYGISRKTGYKWAARYKQAGVSGLEERSRAPHHSPHRTDGACEQDLVALRRRHPRWGPKKLLAILRRREPDRRWPAASTAGEILKRHGLVATRPKKRSKATPQKPVVAAERPNELWAMDFKGEFRTGDGRWCYPLTVSDTASRYGLDCHAQESVAMAPTRCEFEQVFREYGLPEKILSDGGPPFGSARSPQRLSRLTVWMIRLGIEPIKIQPGCPEQNAIHERWHRTLKAETTRPPANNLRTQQRRFDVFRKEYNELRPHESLGQRPPVEFYEPSARPFPQRLPPMEYPGHYEVRRCRSSGQIKWQGRRLFVSEVFIGQWLGLEEIDDGLWSLYLGPLLLGRYHERDRELDLL